MVCQMIGLAAGTHHVLDAGDDLPLDDLAEGVRPANSK
jgi:hypothetical protein